VAVHSAAEDARNSQELLIQEELYSEILSLRHELQEKDDRLVAALQHHRRLGLDLQQALSDRQGLHSEVLLLQHLKGELEERHSREALRREAAEQKSGELERRLVEVEHLRRDLERRCREAEDRCEDFEREAGVRGGSVNDVEAAAKLLEAERRAKEAERVNTELGRRLQDSEQQFRLQAEVKVNEVKLQYAEVDMRRQGEIQAAMRELQALAEGQLALRSELQVGGARPLPQELFSRAALAPMRLRTGQQPWEIWEHSCNLMRAGAQQKGSGSEQQSPGLLLYNKEGPQSLLATSASWREGEPLVPGRLG